jgi:hypothetical protein
MNFESLHSFEQSGPRSGLSFASGRGDRRDWSGLRPKQNSANFVGGVSIRMILREGLDSRGIRIPINFAPPEMVSRARAAWLIERGYAEEFPPKKQS